MSRVLVVDDNSDIAAALVALAKFSGCDAFAVHDGATALRILTEQRIDLVILDCHMPDMSGIEVLKRVKDVASAPPPIVMVSADNEVCDDALEHGAYAFVSKGSTSIDEIIAIFQKYGACR
jgi:CheY-like chemotaxis protein